MVKKTITYKDFNGEEVVENHYFHLSQAELVEMELGREGGLSKFLERIVAAEDVPSLISEFKRIILLAYGQRSPDGRFFKKTQELRDEFSSGEAYSTLFMELVTDTNAAISFINGIIPEGMADKAAELAKSDEPDNSPSLAPVPEEKEVRIITPQDLTGASNEELRAFQEQIASGEARLGDQIA